MVMECILAKRGSPRVSTWRANYPMNRGGLDSLPVEGHNMDYCQSIL